MRSVALRSLLATVLLLVTLAVPVSHAGVLAQADEAAYLDDVLAAREGQTPLIDPRSGSLVQQAAFATVEAAGVSVTDFSARVVFQNPDDASEAWDFGFDFGRSGEASQRIMVDSTGAWRYSPYPDGNSDIGPVPALDTEPGGSNTLDLIVDGRSAILAVNGEFTATIELPQPAESDVFVTTGVYGSTTVDGRELPFEGFSVWSLPDESNAQEATPTPDDIISLEQAQGSDGTPQPVASQPPTEEDQAMFAFLVEAQADVEPVAGPFNANLKEESGPISVSWAGVSLADFHATATFIVPDAAADVPWDVGFMFRKTDDGTMRIVVDQAGTWYVAVGDNAPEATGTLEELDANPGAVNTVDLLVSGDRAVLGVNGTFGAGIDLPPGGTASDVAAGAGFFTDQQQPGRVTTFRDFVVRPFDPATLEDSAQPESAELSKDAEQQFAGYLTNTSGIAPLAGPLAGTLQENGDGTVALASAGVSLADFGAVATFINPDNMSTLWDGGIQFRTDPSAANRIVLRSNGEIQVVQGNGEVAIVGQADGYDATPGAVNTLEVFVVGTQALVGVNNTLVADVSLTAAPVVADVQVGVGFFGEDQLPARVTAYDGFSVWSIS